MKPKIALVLGGGGSRGIAHIGVLEILEREGIQVDLIVGTSMGAIIGGLYASGLTPQTIAENMSDLSGNTIFSMNIFSARARQRDVERQLGRALDGLKFQDLKIPFVAMAVDVLTGKEICLEEGPLIPAILASCAVPAVFPPVDIDGLQLADGGVIDSLATHAAYNRGAERTIAVDIYPPLETDDPWVDPVSAIMGFQLPFNIFNNSDWSRTPSIMASMWRSFRIMAWHIHEERLRTHPADVLLRPEMLGVGSLDFTDIQGPLEAGRKVAEASIEALRAFSVIEDTTG